MKLELFSAMILSAIPAVWPESACALYDEGLSTVVITGVRFWGIEITYDSAITTPTSLFNVNQAAFRATRVSEEYQDWRQEVAMATTDPLNTTDIRCSAIATADTRSVTSKSDSLVRWQAAFQLFTAINAVRGLAGINAAMGASPPELYQGKYHATFSVTYIDGGSDKWVVAPGVAPSLILDAHLAPAPVGDGEPKPCPMRMKG